MNAWEEQLNRIGKALVEQMRDNLSANGSDLTGKLSNSIGYEVTKDTSGNYTLQILMEKYGEYVDSGAERGPGKMPPVRAIQNWIVLRRIKVPTGLSLESFAWAIATNIGKKGQRFKKPKPFIEPAFETVYKNMMDDAMATAFEIEFDKTFTI
jgi:hypothetical protein